MTQPHPYLSPDSIDERSMQHYHPWLLRDAGEDLKVFDKLLLSCLQTTYQYLQVSNGNCKPFARTNSYITGATILTVCTTGNTERCNKLCNKAASPFVDHRLGIHNYGSQFTDPHLRIADYASPFLQNAWRTSSSTGIIFTATKHGGFTRKAFQTCRRRVRGINQIFKI